MKKLAFTLIVFIWSCSCTYRSKHPVPFLRTPPGPASSICPENFVLSPVKAQSKTFCVQMTEASMSGSVAVKKPTEQPSIVKKRSDAISACAALGPKYSLISNAQWQALAQNIESQAKNWSGGLKGNGALSLGHSDDDPSRSLIVAYDQNGCYGTNDSDCSDADWHFQKRTHFLSNGQIVWDLAGNLEEWVKDDPPSLDYTDIAYGLYAYDLSGALKTNFGSSLSDFFALELGLEGGMGLVIDMAEDETQSRGIIRGGSFESAVDAGIFSAKINVLAENEDNEYLVGFRCVYTP